MNVPSPIAKRRARIEIIPLIDIMFFLLATFFMVSMSMIKNEGVNVNLPVAATTAPQEAKDQNDRVTITIADSGEIFFNQEKVEPQQIPTLLRQLKASSTDPQVFINGDDQAYFGKIVGILDEARMAGISKVGIQTKKAPPR